MNEGGRQGGKMSSIELLLHQIIVERLAMTFGDRELSCSYNKIGMPIMEWSVHFQNRSKIDKICRYRLFNNYTASRTSR